MSPFGRSVFLVLVYLSSCGAVGQCPSGWTQYEDYCLSLVKKFYSWPRAQSYCHERGGHLASPSTPNKDFDLKSFLNDKNYEYSTWIDGTDQLQVGSWVWASSQEEISYSNWSPGEPNALKSQLCLSVADRDNHWQNRECSSHHGFVCEVKANFSSGTVVG